MGILGWPIFFSGERVKHGRDMVKVVLRLSLCFCPYEPLVVTGGR